MSRACLLALLGAACALAYNPPSGTAGPLTVRLQRPALGSYGAGGFAPLSRPGLPLLLPVTLENSGDTPLSGTVRIGLIDQWSAEPASRPFSLPPRGRARLEFTIRFGPGTLSAIYPVHAYAEFQHQGRTLVAHPVLLLETAIPDRPVPAPPVEFRAVPVPAGSALGLTRLPVRRESFEVAPAITTARDPFPAAPVFSYGPQSAAGGTWEGIAMTLGKRPPSMRESVPAAAVEYPLRLPAQGPLRLAFAVSGGAGFAVKATAAAGAAAVLYEGRGTPGQWQPASADLSRFAGQDVILRLEARGGAPALWREPVIEAGQPAPPPAFPPVKPAARVLGNAAGCEVRLYAGNRGLLDAPVGFHCPRGSTYFQGFRVRVAGDALERAAAASELLEARVEPSATGYRVRHRFRGWAGAFDVLGELRVERDALRARWWLENAPAPRPWFALTLEAVAAGRWSHAVTRAYAGQGHVFVEPRSLRLSYGGHALATSFAGFDFSSGLSLVQNVDATPDLLEIDASAGLASLVSPHAQTLEFFPARDVWTAVKRLREQDPRSPSAGVARLAGRFTFDLWSGRYAQSAAALRRAAAYGLRDSLVVWHRWQRWGYDYRLPDIYPPDPAFGTLDEFRALTAAAAEAGSLFAPHDNYIDLYPDAEGFSYANVVYRPDSQPYKAWFNYGREAQSYRARPDGLMSYVQRNLKLIRDGLAPTAYFIDVWSSMGPYDYYTADGRFVERSATRDAWAGIFDWIRNYLGNDAPQISEAGHDKLIGSLDGADAQHLRVDTSGAGFTINARCADSERIPWFDFAWHDKFILHGAGYPGRYEGGLGAAEHGIESDDYIATEVLTGHPAMTAQPFSPGVVRKFWLLDGILRGLALARIEAVEFSNGDIHRQHVRWSNGEVWVNRGTTEWTVQGHVLPRYGFFARVAGREAGIEKRAGRTIEWAYAPESLYLNPRGGTLRVGPLTTSVPLRVERGFRVTLAPASSSSEPVSIPLL